jgi:hypothetical protein
MKISTNKKELKELDACKSGYKVFIEAHGDKEVKLSEALDSNGWDDIWWFISETYDQFSDKQKQDLRVFGCNAALINIEKIKPYCSERDYELITSYLNNPTESALSAAGWAAESVAGWAAESVAESARSAAWSARSAAWSARSAAWSAAESARSAGWAARSAESAESAGWAAESAAMKGFTKQLRDLFVKWESGNE